MGLIFLLFTNHLIISLRSLKGDEVLSNPECNCMNPGNGLALNGKV